MLFGMVLYGMLLGIPLSSCTRKNQQLESCVDSFAQSYFRWRFSKAMNSCDTASYRWLSFVASQVTQADLNSLRDQKKDLTCSLGNTHFPNDSMAIVDVRVSNFLHMDSLGSVTFVEKETVYGIYATLHDGFWKVSLRKIPKPKKEG